MSVQCLLGINGRADCLDQPPVTAGLTLIRHSATLESTLAGSFAKYYKLAVLSDLADRFALSSEAGLGCDQAQGRKQMQCDCQ